MAISGDLGTTVLYKLSSADSSRIAGDGSLTGVVVVGLVVANASGSLNLELHGDGWNRVYANGATTGTGNGQWVQLP